MNWIRNFIKPKLKALISRDVPDNLWHKCDNCHQMLFYKELQEQLNVCSHCGFHLRIDPKERMNLLFDRSTYSIMPLPEVLQDPIKFKDLKKYGDRLKDARHKTHYDDALVVAHGEIGGMKTVAAVFNFDFMGGSMGMAVGQGIVHAANLAVREKAALLIIPSSGGARMQEGILSLMQMARTTIAINELKDAGLPYVVLLAHPTSGGVTASFAMIGDVTLAEPGATICFSGRRVIEQTIKQQLPDEFQTAEYLKDHGMVDQVVHRKDLPQVLGNILSILMKKSKVA